MRFSALDGRKVFTWAGLFILFVLAPSSLLAQNNTSDIDHSVNKGFFFGFTPYLRIVRVARYNEYFYDYADTSSKEDYTRIDDESHMHFGLVVEGSVGYRFNKFLSSELFCQLKTIVTAPLANTSVHAQSLNVGLGIGIQPFERVSFVPRIGFYTEFLGSYGLSYGGIAQYDLKKKVKNSNLSIRLGFYHMRYSSYAYFEQPSNGYAVTSNLSSKVYLFDAGLMFRWNR